MEKRIIKLTWMLITTVFSGCTTAAVAAGLTVNPGTITNDYVGKITMIITNLTPGQTVVLEKYGDLNTNGVIDAGEPVLQSGVIIEGTSPTIGGARNLNVPGDEDGATNGQVRMELFYPGPEKGLNVIAGKYLIRVSDPASGFAPVTNSFEVKQKVFLQGVSGRITASGTGIPLANAPVVLLPPDGEPVTGTVTDANGNYTLHSPPGNYMVLPLAPGFVGDFNGGVTVSASTFATLDLALPAADRTISGKLKDSCSRTGIRGVFIQAESASGQFVSAFSDSAGNYSVGVLADSWELESSSGHLAQLGYVGWNNGTTVSTVSGSVANLDLPVDPATALIYGTVKDAQDNPVIGVGFWSDEESRQYSASGTTFPTNANYCLGVRAGSWWVGPESRALIALGYIGQETNVTVTASQALRVDFVLRQANAHLLGQVVDNLGAPVGDIDFYAHDSQGSHISTTTDANGNFDLLVFGGTWNLNIPEEDAQPRGYLTTNLTLTVTNGEIRSGITFVTQRPTAHLRGRLVDNVGAGVGDIQFGAYNNNPSRWFWTRTDANGNFDIGVIAGSWSLNLSSGDAQTRGLIGPNLPAFNVVNGVDQNSILVIAQRTTAQINGYVRNNSGNPITNLGIWSSAVVNGTNYGAYTWTDASGNYQLMACNETWQVGLNCGGNQSLQSYGYVCGNPVVTNVAGTNVTLNFVVQPAVALQIATPSLPDGTVGVYYDQSLGVSGGQPPCWWWLPDGTFSLPPGMFGDMNFSSQDTYCTISGIPGTAGTFSFWVGVSDNASPPNVVTQMVSITIRTAGSPLAMAATSLPNAQQGASYSSQLQASGGQLPYSWSLAPGSLGLPPNLNLSPGGVISGTPATHGTFFFIARVTDANSTFIDRSLALTINPKPTLTALHRNGNQFQLQLNGAIGQTYTVQYSTDLAGTNWLSLLTTNPTAATVTILDLNATNSARFYRAVVGP